jgi:hypothetical protein
MLFFFALLLSTSLLLQEVVTSTIAVYLQDTFDCGVFLEEESDPGFQEPRAELAVQSQRHLAELDFLAPFLGGALPRQARAWVMPAGPVVLSLLFFPHTLFPTTDDIFSLLR